jgi:hypothetical protein
LVITTACFALRLLTIFRVPDNEANRAYCMSGSSGAACRRASPKSYVGSDMSALRKVIDEYIFCLVYPNSLLRRHSGEFHRGAGRPVQRAKTSFDTPYIVHSRVIFGEVFSLIQLKSRWCRGYMMLQTEEASFLDLARR